MNEPELTSTPQAHDDHLLDQHLIEWALSALTQAKSTNNVPVPSDASAALPLQLPAQGLGARAALEAMAQVALAGAAKLHHPGYFAHMDPPTATVTWLAAMWQAAMNQNQLHPDVAPSSRSLEVRLIDWLAPYFNMHGGHLVPGSTIANLTAVWAARDLKGVRRVVASERAHLSLRKSAHLLGLAYESVATNDQHQMQLSPTADYSDAVVVLTAGTVATGAIDPPVANQCGWLHMDAAWGGPLRFSDSHAALLEHVATVDSVGFSAHKWCFQPKGAAVILFKEPDAAHAAMSYGGGYLAAPNIGVAGSAPATAIPFAASLMAWGRDGLAQRIELGMQQAEVLAAKIQSDARFELWGTPTTGVVVWRPRHLPAGVVRDQLNDAWVSLTDIDGEVWLRSVAANLSADASLVFAKVCAALETATSE